MLLKLAWVLFWPKNNMMEGIVQPIIYGSQTLQQHEKKYGATDHELEALGLCGQ